MRLRLQTDYSLRVLLFLTYVDRKATVEEIASAYAISREHLVKVVQNLASLGFVRTHPGRGGGVSLVADPSQVTVREVVEKVEGRPGVLECVLSPDVCPMEPGCGLRSLLMSAEEAFYAALEKKTLRDLCGGKRATGGIRNLDIQA